MSVQIIQIEPVRKGRKLKVTADTGITFMMKQNDVTRLALTADTELSEEAFQELLSEYVYKAACQDAMQLLMRKDHTVAELSRKLRMKGYPEEAAAHAMDYVASYHYTDDQRFAEYYVMLRKDAYSRMVLRQKLMQKGISEDIISEVLEASDISDVDSAAALLRKKYGHLDGETPDNKVIQFLMRKGYNYSDIRDAMALLRESD